MSADTPRRQPIEHLAELYAVVAALALTSAIGDVLFPLGTTLDLDWLEILVGIGFLVTLVPFVHGALVYLHRRHSGAPRTRREQVLVLWDFFLLFVQAIVLLVAARVVDQPKNLVAVLAVLWAIDIVWILVGESLVPSAFEDSTERGRWPWTIINGVAILVAALIWLLTSDGSSAVVAWAVAGLTMTRTAFDYTLGWSNYFPPLDVLSET